MKIKFEKNLEYQLDAINSVIDIFAGQEINKTVFTVERLSNLQMKLGRVENELGIGNSLLLYPEEILKNLNNIQLRNGLARTTKLEKNNYNFSVEMETGTGKTYVYLRSIMELNKKYGFTKFIIVVPSIAIKEGVYKTLQITKEHFKELYENIPYDYFIYDSKKIDMIRNFAVNDTIQIMVINIDAFNKDTNIINQERDQANGYKPIDYIKECNPIVIIDEPQNMESEKAKEAIKELNPLCTLRYSATHKDKYNLVFKLDAIDAYEKKLVKQIEVASIQREENNNMDYIRVISIKANKNGIFAKLELDVRTGNSVKRKEITVKKGDFLKDKAKRNIYDGYIVNEITVNEIDSAKSFIDLGKVVLTLGQVNGEQKPDELKRLQIRQTIKEHFDKQKRLRNKNIKVLSLFFIDKVSNYRIYDSETGEAKKGKYALMFEEEYNKLLETKEYMNMGDQTVPLFERASVAHDGYFSIDKKKSKSGKEYFEDKDTKGNTKADDDTFNKIMRDKEKLLNFDEPLSFIFSHSALKEGWDNPNVFQICTLNETVSEIKKRQEIGRGLRIAVNQNGERVRGFEINTLTVMVNEAYSTFVDSLQKEIENEGNIKFGLIESHIFTNIIVKNENGEEKFLGYEESENLYKFLKENKYIDQNGKTQEKLKIDLDENKLVLPEKFKNLRTEITLKLEGVAKKLVVKDINNKKKIKLHKEVLISPEFKELWDKIKYKTTYQVNFDGEKLIQECIEAIDNNIYIPEEKYLFEKARLKINKSGIEEIENYHIEENLRANLRYNYNLPDIVSYLQNETNLTRKSIVEILTKTRTLESFRNNPQLYLEEVTKILKEKMKDFLVDGIKYQKIGDDSYYSQELFKTEELFGYLKTEMSKLGNMVESEKSPYSNVVVDSDIERKFATSLEQNKNVKVYAKLSSWFKIPTPLGTYNPDWVVLITPDDMKEDEKLYFIVETKGGIFESLRTNEKMKIKCGKKHFEAISSEITFEITSKFENFRNHW